LIKRRTYYLVFTIWSLIYIIGTLIAPLAPNRFSLTEAKTRLIQITIALPVVLIWLAAIYGAEHFNSYARSIKSSKDGKALSVIGIGLTTLAAAVMSGGLGGILRPWALRDGWIETFTVIYNYLQVSLYLIAFYFIYKGSVMLRGVAITKKESISSWIPVLVTIVIIGAFYTFILLGYDYRNSTPDPRKYSSFYLPDFLVFATLALPYLIGWALGIKSALNIAFYHKKVKGIIYRSALKNFVNGIYLVIAFAVALQMLIALSTYFAEAGLASILLVVYLIIVFYSLGFLILAAGSKKLNTIEKVKI
jgi:hypothetical protein